MNGEQSASEAALLWIASLAKEEAARRTDQSETSHDRAAGPKRRIADDGRNP